MFPRIQFRARSHFCSPSGAVPSQALQRYDEPVSRRQLTGEYIENNKNFCIAGAECRHHDLDCGCTCFIQGLGRHDFRAGVGPIRI